jgi:hypothetical protein
MPDRLAPPPVAGVPGPGSVSAEGQVGDVGGPDSSATATGPTAGAAGAASRIAPATGSEPGPASGNLNAPSGANGPGAGALSTEAVGSGPGVTAASGSLGSAAVPSDVVSQGQGPQGSGATSKRLNKRGAKEPLPTERPPGAPIDPWTAFATTSERPPGLIRRATRGFFRSFVHEYALAIYAGLLLAVALTWPTLRYPLHTLPEDLGDPARQAWQISWIGHILLTHPQQLWQSNAFYPEPNSFAFGDSLLGYGPVGMLGDGPLAATLRYNILFVLAHALLAIGGYALVRQLGAGRTGAAVAAVAIAYAPWRLAQGGHLDIISAGGIPLALAMLARGHGWSLRRGLRANERNAGWAAFGWLFAAWQVSLGFSLGLPFLGVLGLIVLILLVGTPTLWLRRRTRRRAHHRLLIANGQFLMGQAQGASPGESQAFASGPAGGHSVGGQVAALQPPADRALGSQPVSSQLLTDHRDPNQPRTGQPQPLSSQGQPLASQPQPIASQGQSLANQPQPVASQGQSLPGQPQPLASQGRPLASQPQPLTGEGQSNAAQTVGSQLSTGRPGASQSVGGETGEGSSVNEDTARSERASELLVGSQPNDGQSAGSQPAGEQPGETRPVGSAVENRPTIPSQRQLGQPLVARSSDERPVDGQTLIQPVPGQPEGDQPTAIPSAIRQPAGQPTVGQLAGAPSTVNQPADPQVARDLSVGDQPADGQSVGNPPAYAQLTGAQTGGNLPANAQPADGQSVGNQLADAQPAGGQPAGNQPADTQPAGAQSVGNQPADTQPAGAQPAGNQPADTQLTGSQPIGSQPTDPQLIGGRTVGNQPTDARPTDGQPGGDQPADPQPTGDQTAGNRPANAQPAGGQSVSNRPADGQLAGGQSVDSRLVGGQLGSSQASGIGAVGGESASGQSVGNEPAASQPGSSRSAESLPVREQGPGATALQGQSKELLDGEKPLEGQAAEGRSAEGKPTKGRGGAGWAARWRGKRRRRANLPVAVRESDFVPVLGWRLLIIDALGPLILAGIAALIALPYFHLADKSNSTAEIKFFSPPLWSLLIGPAESRVWGAPHEVARSALGWPAEMSLLPGFVLYALALAGLWFSVWKFHQRILLMIALAAAVVLTLGTNFFGGHWSYLPLFAHLPASLDLRIPGRMMLWVTLLLGILAAGAVAEFVRRAEHWSAQRIPPWPAWWLRLATLVPLMFVIAEGWNTTAHPVVPAQPASMRTITSPMLVLPTGAVTDGTVMLWSTSRYQKIANGSGGFAATRQAQMRNAVASFPDAASIQYLRSINVTTVLLIRSAIAGTPWERAGDIPVTSLGITREDAADAVIFHLS